MYNSNPFYNDYPQNFNYPNQNCPYNYQPQPSLYSEGQYLNSQYSYYPPYSNPQEFVSPSLLAAYNEFMEKSAKASQERRLREIMREHELINEQIRQNSLETQRLLDAMVASTATSQESLETLITQFTKTTIEPSYERQVDVVANVNESEIERPSEDGNDVESFSEERVEIEEASPIILPSEVVEEVEKETPHVSPAPYNPPILVPQEIVEAKVDPIPKTCEKKKNVKINAHRDKGANRKSKLGERKFEDNVSAKRMRVTFGKANKSPKTKERRTPEIEPKPPPKISKSFFLSKRKIIEEGREAELPYRRKKRKSEGYVRILDKWPWKSFPIRPPQER